MVITLGAAHSSEVNTLVSKAFGYIAPHSFFDDFPVWDLRLRPNLHNEKNIFSFGIIEKNVLISHVGVRIAEMQTPTGSVQIGLIGAVATDSTFRGKGHSSALLKHAIHYLEGHHCSWKILWGSEHDFYAKLGFSLQGEQARAPLATLLSKHSQDLNQFSDVKSGMSEEIFRFLINKKSGIKLMDSDRPWVFAQKTVNWYSFANPFAFVGIGRGMDMGHIIHEFGGDRDSLLTIMSKIFLNDGMAQIMGTKNDLLLLGLKEDELILEKLCLAQHKTTQGSAQEKWSNDFWISGLGSC